MCTTVSLENNPLLDKMLPGVVFRPSVITFSAIWEVFLSTALTVFSNDAKPSQKDKIQHQVTLFLSTLFERQLYILTH